MKALILGAVLLALTSCGGSLTPAQQARLDKFECRAKALEPLVDDVLDAQQLVRDVYAGRASLNAVLQALGASQDEVKVLIEALNACDVPAGIPELPEGDPS